MISDQMDNLDIHKTGSGVADLCTCILKIQSDNIGPWNAIRAQRNLLVHEFPVQQDVWKLGYQWAALKAMEPLALAMQNLHRNAIPKIMERIESLKEVCQTFKLKP
jgi:hypothetical protein